MTTLFPRISLSLRMVAVTLLVLLSGSWGLMLQETAQEPTTHPALAGLPAEAQFAISRLLGSDDKDYHLIPTEAGFSAIHPTQALEADFTLEGAQVRVGEVRWKLALLSYGYDEALEPVTPVQPQAKENHVEYARGEITEWYVNGPLGLQQGFTLLAPPAGSDSAEGSPLTLALGLPAGLRASVEADGAALTLTQANGLAVLRYKGLLAYDATGRHLPARLEVRDAQVLVRVEDAGATYPLTIDPWIQQAKLTASDGAADDAFGSAIAMNGDTIIVGAAGDNADQGSAYVFTKPSGGWATMTETAKLTASDGVAKDWFGWSVAIDADTVIVGSLGGTYGTSTKPGAAYVFVKPVGGWVDMTQTAKLTASDGAANDQFGYSVAIQGDTVVVGAIFVGSTYVFVKPVGGWVDMTQTAKLTSSAGPTVERLGYSVAITDDTLIVGALGFSTGEDSAHVFVKPGGGWITTTQTAKLTASDGVTGDAFGWSIAFKGDTAVIGAQSDAIGANHQQGSAYVFVKPGGGWITTTQTAKLTASDGAATDLFGWSVALNGDRVVVGAVFDDIDANIDQGSAYVFVKPGGGWIGMTETTKLTASDGAANDGFGWSIALNGDTLAVGAYIDDIGAKADQGSAYVFGLTTPVKIYLPLIVK